MIQVVITGIGLISALGESLEESWHNLIAGHSAIKLHQPFPQLKPYPLAMIGAQPAGLKILTQLVVSSALKDAGLVPPLPDCGVVIGSSRSYQGLWEEMVRNMGVHGEETNEAYNSSYPTPHTPYPTPFLHHWLETLPHMNAIAAARQIGACGVVLAPMAACSTGIWAIAQAAHLIQTGQCQRVIAGAVEAPITPLTLTGFQQMGALATTGAYPFDVHREGLVLGEGGAVFVLESLELAKQRQAKIYGQILGFGLTNDAGYVVAPDSEGKSAIAAIKQCLRRSQLTPNDIDYIHAHGTATQLNDRIESLIIQQLFSLNVAVSSTKGSTGHTLGASGALGTAFSLVALNKQISPPCIGLKEPEFDLNFVREIRETVIRHVLCLSFGFGGQNTVLALKTWV
ncbi:MAG: beta-ketoacyl-ACP synthase [Scytonema sp. PMC 1069.18]|nr:beta-ketoacyl-ACP synthase [Scytonema sp. PMC 1069.18]MEC4882824.1 beta-ketoacyl-ACP synthase [Scytonema sp. PMC 1070.18]